MQDKKLDLSFFHVFGALYYPTNDNDNDDLGSGLHSMTPATSSLGLVPNPVSQQPCIPPPRDDYDRLFQPMFNEYFIPPSIVWKTRRGLNRVSGFGIGEVVLSTFDVLQRFGFFLQMGFTLILATLDGLDVGLLGDVIGGDDYDDDE
ncbi:hypothetical protein Tco_0824753 [Tanacetum coccineum]|uniref:Uncharacterized protein n=1 Tax=Tanacetum coccineum TaxID=301880 RepID=A0ABQ5ARB8_9ASTR